MQPTSGNAARSESNDAKNAPVSGSSFSQVLATYSKSNNDGADRAPSKSSKDAPDNDGKAADDPSAGAAVAPPQKPLTITGLLGLLQQQHQADAQETSGDSSADAAKAEAAQQNPQPNFSILKPIALPVTALAPTVSASKAWSKAGDAKTPPPGHAAPIAPAVVALPIDPARVPGGEIENAPNQADQNQADQNQADVDPAVGAANGASAPQTGNTTAANGAAALSAHAPLAFSMLVSPDNPASENATPATAAMAAGSPDAPALAPEIPHFSSAMAAAAAVETTPGIAGEHPSDAQANSMAAPVAQAEGARGSDSGATAVESSAATSGAQADSAADASRNEAVRNVRLQVEGENNQRVDVRLTDQGGELRVNVRSADATLTQAMQDHMPDLTNRLQQQHFRTEVWLPRSSQTSNSDASNTRGSNSQAGHTSDQQNSGRRQNGRQHNQRDWQDEDIPSQTGTKETNQIWQA